METIDELSDQGVTVGDPWLDATQSYMIFATGQQPRDLVEARR